MFFQGALASSSPNIVPWQCRSVSLCHWPYPISGHIKVTPNVYCKQQISNKYYQRVLSYFVLEIINLIFCFLTRVPLSPFSTWGNRRRTKWLFSFISTVSLEPVHTHLPFTVFSSLPPCLSLKYYLIQELLSLSSRLLKRTLNKNRPHADTTGNTLPWVIRTCPPASSQSLWQSTRQSRC